MTESINVNFGPDHIPTDLRTLLKWERSLDIKPNTFPSEWPLFQSQIKKEIVERLKASATAIFQKVVNNYEYDFSDPTPKVVSEIPEYLNPENLQLLFEDEWMRIESAYHGKYGFEAGTSQLKFFSDKSFSSRAILLPSDSIIQTRTVSLKRINND